MNALINIDSMAVEYSDMNGNQIQLDKDTVTRFLVGDGKVSDQDVVLFCKLCESRKINPFLREAYLIPYGGKAQMVVSKDFFMKRADANEDYDGEEDGIMVLTADGQIVERAGTFYLPSEKLVGGWCKVYRKSRTKPTYKAVTLAEAGGQMKGLWGTQPAVMVNKVAISRALRDSFPNDFGGLYTRDELNTEDLEEKQMPTESVTVQPADVKPAPAKVLNDAEERYKAAVNRLKIADGGAFTAEHKKALGEFNARVKSGDESALAQGADWFENEAAKVEFANEAVGE